MMGITTNRRDLLITPLYTALGAGGAGAAGVDPNETIVKLPDQIPWQPIYDFPPGMAEQALMFGNLGEAGQYFVLIRWHPGYMSAPHWYETDRLCVVLSGTWYVASGADFAPEAAVPVPAGSFVRRVARTPHSDGVRAGIAEPAIIAISGLGPIHFNLIDASKPGWRQL